MSLFPRLSSVCVNRKTMRWNTEKWIGKGIMYIVYINGKKFAGEQDRSLFPAWDGLRANAQNIRVRC